MKELTTCELQEYCTADHLCPHRHTCPKRCIHCGNCKKQHTRTRCSTPPDPAPCPEQTCQTCTGCKLQTTNPRTESNVHHIIQTLFTNQQDTLTRLIDLLNKENQK